MICNNEKYHRVLVKGGCSINVCLNKTFIKWGYKREELKPTTREDLGDDYASRKHGVN